MLLHCSSLFDFMTEITLASVHVNKTQRRARCGKQNLKGNYSKELALKAAVNKFADYIEYFVVFQLTFV